MTPKQTRFVAEYLIDLNATQAAIRAGYSAKTADVQGPRLLGNVGVRAAIATGKATQLDQADLSAARTLEELRRVAYGNIKSVFDEQGNLKPVHTLTDGEAAMISSVEVIIKNAEAGDGHTDRIHKIKCWDKVRALHDLCEHFELLVTNVRVTSDEAMFAFLDEMKAKNRAAKP